jgi:hypothetical protein
MAYRNANRLFFKRKLSDSSTIQPIIFGHTPEVIARAGCAIIRFNRNVLLVEAGFSLNFNYK